VWVVQPLLLDFTRAMKSFREIDDLFPRTARNVFYRVGKWLRRD